MKILFYSTMSFEKEQYLSLNSRGYDLHFVESHLDELNVNLAEGFDAICIFVNDKLTDPIAKKISELGIKIVALRCAGFNNVNIEACKKYEITVVRVPEYSPFAVAEHTTALLLSLNRKIHKAYLRVREGNFSLGGLIGFDLHGKNVGVVGTGKIGKAFCKIMLGFGTNISCYDLVEDKELSSLGVKYTSLEDIWMNSDIISLHVPLNKETHHLIDANTINLMKENVIILNTSRGALVDTKALIQALKLNRIKGAALDVYEEEDKLFFHDLSEFVIQDDDITRLMTFPNVLITAHQAFLTTEALKAIVNTTFSNLHAFFTGEGAIYKVV